MWDSMSKEYGIIKIKKADSEEVKEIKKQNNAIINKIFDSNGYSFYSGLFSGIAISLLFATLSAFRNNSFIGEKIAYAIGTLLSGVLAAATYVAKDINKKEPIDQVNEMATESIDEKVENQLRLRSKNSIKRINM